jgi:hypothetical protein
MVRGFLGILHIFSLLYVVASYLRRKKIAGLASIEVKNHGK